MRRVLFVSVCLSRIQTWGDTVVIRHLRAAIAVLFLWGMLQSPALASRVSPMAVELDPFGRGSVARIEFTNTANRDFPIEVRAYLGDITEDGELNLVPADDDFLIFPPQMVIGPLEGQVVRVQYVGEPDLDEARVYYIALSELPIELEGGSPKVQITVRFNVFASVEPEGVSAVPRIDTVDVAIVEEVAGVNVRLANDGKGMLMAGQRSWTVTGMTVSGEPFEREFPAARMGTVLGAGIVAPGKARNFFIPLEIEADPASVIIAIE